MWSFIECSSQSCRLITSRDFSGASEERNIGDRNKELKLKNKNVEQKLDTIPLLVHFLGFIGNRIYWDK